MYRKRNTRLFDEPSSVPDPEMNGEVLDVIEALAAEGVTMTFDTHQAEFARKLAQQVFSMENTCWGPEPVRTYSDPEPGKGDREPEPAEAQGGKQALRADQP